MQIGSQEGPMCRGTEGLRSGRLGGPGSGAKAALGRCRRRLLLDRLPLDQLLQVLHVHGRAELPTETPFLGGVRLWRIGA